MRGDVRKSLIHDAIYPQNNPTGLYNLNLHKVPAPAKKPQRPTKLRHPTEI